MSLDGALPKQGPATWHAHAPCSCSLPTRPPVPCTCPSLQTSLAQFDALYELAIDQSERAPIPAKRIHNIIEHMTYEIYLYCQRGLFERHKLIFALMLATKILVGAGTACVVREGTGWGKQACQRLSVGLAQVLGRHACPVAEQKRPLRMLRCAAQVSAGQIKAEEMDAFLKMGGALDLASVRKKPRVRGWGAGGRAATLTSAQN